LFLALTIAVPIPSGSIIKIFHPFIAGYPQDGGMSIGSIAGKGMNGTTSESHTSNFNRTGTTGKRPAIWRSKIPGVSRV
jgi:hypothetical protein